MIMEENKLCIRISYLLMNNSEWKVFHVTPEEYFDLDKGEQVEIDSVPFFNHALDYIKDDIEKVVRTNVEIIDKYRNKKRIITTSYWNNQENRITKRVDTSSDLIDSEIIIQTKIQKEPPVFEILRVIMENNTMVPIYHGFITDNEDGSQFENRIL